MGKEDKQRYFLFGEDVFDLAWRQWRFFAAE